MLRLPLSTVAVLRLNRSGHLPPCHRSSSNRTRSSGPHQRKAITSRNAGAVVSNMCQPVVCRYPARRWEASPPSGLRVKSFVNGPGPLRSAPGEPGSCWASTAAGAGSRGSIQLAEGVGRLLPDDEQLERSPARLAAMAAGPVARSPPGIPHRGGSWIRSPSTRRFECFVEQTTDVCRPPPAFIQALYGGHRGRCSSVPLLGSLLEIEAGGLLHQLMHGGARRQGGRQVDRRA